MSVLVYCTGCSTDKPIEGFSRNRAMKTGYANWCKVCLQKLQGRPEYRIRRRRKRESNIVHQLIIESKNRAKKAGIEFDLTIDDLEWTGVCPVLGIPLQVGVGWRKDDSPSLDRHDPTKGYVKGNVVVVSFLVNRLKSNVTDPAIFDAIARYMRGMPNGGPDHQDGLRAQAVAGDAPQKHEAVERYRMPSPVRKDGIRGQRISGPSSPLPPTQPTLRLHRPAAQPSQSRGMGLFDELH